MSGPADLDAGPGVPAAFGPGPLWRPHPPEGGALSPQRPLRPALSRPATASTDMRLLMPVDRDVSGNSRAPSVAHHYHGRPLSAAPLPPEDTGAVRSRAPSRLVGPYLQGNALLMANHRANAMSTTVTHPHAVSLMATPASAPPLGLPYATVTVGSPQRVPQRPAAAATTDSPLSPRSQHLRDGARVALHKLAPASPTRAAAVAAFSATTVVLPSFASYLNSEHRRRRARRGQDHGLVLATPAGHAADGVSAATTTGGGSALAGIGVLPYVEAPPLPSRQHAPPLDAHRSVLAASPTQTGYEPFSVARPVMRLVPAPAAPPPADTRWHRQLMTPPPPPLPMMGFDPSGFGGTAVPGGPAPGFPFPGDESKFVAPAWPAMAVGLPPPPRGIESLSRNGHRARSGAGSAAAMDPDAAGDLDADADGGDDEASPRRVRSNALPTYRHSPLSSTGRSGSEQQNAHKAHAASRNRAAARSFAQTHPHTYATTVLAGARGARGAPRGRDALGAERKSPPPARDRVRAFDEVVHMYGTAPAIRRPAGHSMVLPPDPTMTSPPPPPPVPAPVAVSPQRLDDVRHAHYHPVPPPFYLPAHPTPHLPVKHVSLRPNYIPQHHQSSPAPDALPTHGDGDGDDGDGEPVVVGTKAERKRALLQQVRAVLHSTPQPLAFDLEDVNDKYRHHHQRLLFSDARLVRELVREMKADERARAAAARAAAKAARQREEEAAAAVAARALEVKRMRARQAERQRQDELLRREYEQLYGQQAFAEAEAARQRAADEQAATAAATAAAAAVDEAAAPPAPLTIESSSAGAQSSGTTPAVTMAAATDDDGSASASASAGRDDTDASSSAAATAAAAALVQSSGGGGGSGDASASTPSSAASSAIGLIPSRHTRRPSGALAAETAAAATATDESDAAADEQRDSFVIGSPSAGSDAVRQHERRRRRHQTEMRRRALERELETERQQQVRAIRAAVIASQRPAVVAFVANGTLKAGPVAGAPVVHTPTSPLGSGGSGGLGGVGFSPWLHEKQPAHRHGQLSALGSAAPLASVGGAPAVCAEDRATAESLIAECGEFTARHVSAVVSAGGAVGPSATPAQRQTAVRAEHARFAALVRDVHALVAPPSSAATPTSASSGNSGGSGYGTSQPGPSPTASTGDVHAATGPHSAAAAAAAAVPDLTFVIDSDGDDSGAGDSQDVSLPLTGQRTTGPPPTQSIGSVLANARVFLTSADVAKVARGEPVPADAPVDPDRVLTVADCRGLLFAPPAAASATLGAADAARQQRARRAYTKAALRSLMALAAANVKGNGNTIGAGGSSASALAMAFDSPAELQTAMRLAVSDYPVDAKDSAFYDALDSAALRDVAHHWVVTERRRRLRLLLKQKQKRQLLKLRREKRDAALRRQQQQQRNSLSGAPSPPRPVSASRRATAPGALVLSRGGTGSGAAATASSATATPSESQAQAPLSQPQTQPAPPASGQEATPATAVEEPPSGDRDAEEEAMRELMESRRGSVSSQLSGGHASALTPTSAAAAAVAAAAAASGAAAGPPQPDDTVVRSAAAEAEDDAMRELTASRETTPTHAAQALATQPAAVVSPSQSQAKAKAKPEALALQFTVTPSTPLSPPPVELQLPSAMVSPSVEAASRLTAALMPYDLPVDSAAPISAKTPVSGTHAGGFATAIANASGVTVEPPSQPVSGEDDAIAELMAMRGGGGTAAAASQADSGLATTTTTTTTTYVESPDSAPAAERTTVPSGVVVPSVSAPEPVFVSPEGQSHEDDAMLQRLASRTGAAPASAAPIVDVGAADAVAAAPAPLSG